MKCTSCGAIISTKITTCDFCGVPVKQTVEETIVEVFTEEEEVSAVNCNSYAMFECMDSLGDYFRYFDSSAYEATEDSRYYLSVQLTNKLYEIIRDTAPDWESSDMFGILIEDTDSIYRNESGLIVTFDGDATVLFTNGLAGISVVDNKIHSTGHSRWDGFEDGEVGFWLDTESFIINFGPIKEAKYFWGARWIFSDSVDDFSQTVIDANSWVKRIQKIALGIIPVDSVANPDYANQKKLPDGSRWLGALDAKWLMTGYGVHKLVNGDIYEGYSHAGFRHGEGKYTWRSGQLYEGNWANGQQHGYGVHTNIDGSELKGNWLNGVFQG